MSPPALTDPELVERARRLGPLPYSALGMWVAPPLPPAADLAAWQVETMDRCWLELARPDPFTVVDMAAGDGSRAREVLTLGPLCLDALRYVLVEPDGHLAALHDANLSIEAPELLFGPVAAHADEEDDEPVEAAGIGPRVTSLADLPVLGGPGVMFAIGWASRFPSDRIEFREGRWWELRLAAGPDGLVELPVPLDADRTAEAAALAGDAPREGRYPILRGAVSWLAQAFRVAPVGWLAVLDHWVPVTAPVAEGEAPALALDQLSSLRRPEGGAPIGVLSSMSVVCWRLG